MLVARRSSLSAQSTVFHRQLVVCACCRRMTSPPQHSSCTVKRAQEGGSASKKPDEVVLRAPPPWLCRRQVANPRTYALLPGPCFSRFTMIATVGTRLTNCSTLDHPRCAATSLARARECAASLHYHACNDWCPVYGEPSTHWVHRVVLDPVI